MLVALSAVVAGCGGGAEVGSRVPYASVRVCGPYSINNRPSRNCTSERMPAPEYAGSPNESIVSSPASTRPEVGSRVRGVVAVCGTPTMQLRGHAEPATCDRQEGYVEMRDLSGKVVARTDLTLGRFSLSLRPGRYVLVAWNRGNGPWKQDVRIVAGDTTITNVVIEAI